MNNLPKEMFSHRYTYSEELRIIHLFTNYDLTKTKQLIASLQNKDNNHFYYSNYVRNLIIFIQSLSIQCLGNECSLQSIEQLRDKSINNCLETLLHEDCNQLFSLEMKIVDDFYKLYTSSYRLSSPIVYKIVTSISNDIKNATVRNISNKIGYSQSHCTAVFKSYYNQTLESYIIDKKISYVKIALLDNIELQQIVDEVGFSSIAYMNRVFKKYTTISIKQFKTLTT